MSKNHTPDEFPWIILKKASIRPDKIVYYDQFIKRNPIPKKPALKFSKEEKEHLMEQGLWTGRMPVLNTHNFDISKKASNRIKEKISWLYQLSKNQTITTSKNKVITSFKMNFITLTLPSVQVHKTEELTKKCLSQFIQECQQNLGLKNYVWRLEFQKNGNAHYHIATDTFIEYWQCRKIWNRVLNKLGYIDAYKHKMSQYDFKSYYKEFHKEGTEDYQLLFQRYSAGCQTNWEQPNTVDCRNVASAKNIAYYISKYITKKPNEQKNTIAEDREGTNSNIRLWFCSQKLSKLSKIEVFLDEVNELTDNILEFVNIKKEIVFDYCKIQYFNFSEQINSMKFNLSQLFYRYANEKEYYT